MTATQQAARMRVTKRLMTVVMVGIVASGWACTQRTANEAKKGTDVALDATKTGADKSIDAIKAAGDKTADVAVKAGNKTAEVAGQAAEDAKALASATAVAVTDGWITAKLKAKFADETVLKGSRINVDTKDHAVTLKGTVPSMAAKARAAVIASGTENVSHVDNQLVVVK